MEIKTVGVIGAGVMGVGVAQNIAQTDHQVIIVDISADILEHAKQEIKNNIRFQGFLKKSVEVPENTLQKITFTTDYQLLKNIASLRPIPRRFLLHVLALPLNGPLK